MVSEQLLELPPIVAPQAEEADALDQPLFQAHQQLKVRPRAKMDNLLALFAAISTLILVAPNLPTTFGGMFGMQLNLGDLVLAAVFFFLWPRVLYLAGVYEARINSVRSEIFSLLVACCAGSLLALGLLQLSSIEEYSVRAVVIFWMTLVTVLLTFRGFAEAVNVRFRSSIPRRVLIVGSGLRARRLADELKGSGGKYDLIGFVDDDSDSADPTIRSALLGRIDDLEGILVKEVVDEVLIALPIKSCYAAIEKAIEVSERVGVESKYLADVFRCQLAKVRYEQRRSIPFISVKVVYDDYRVQVKRAMDFTGAFIGLLMLSPFLLVIGLAVKLSSPGPIIFGQERYGLNKRRFKMYKFRTMVPNAEKLQAQLEAQNEAIGPVFKIKADPRVTTIGRFLRKTSLDELPQLINVLKGDMSLVGPRPLPVRDVQLFNEAWFMRRFSVRPGMTCLWQISGRSNLGFDDWVALDLKYIDEWSLRSDLRILARTIPAVVRGVGAA